MTEEIKDSCFRSMKRFLYVLMFFCAMSVFDVAAQIDKSEVRSGNRYFEDGEYSKADIEYRKALVKDSLSLAANYNLASNLYRMGDYPQALKVMENIMGVAVESDYAMDYYYNLADIAIACKEYQTAKEALEKYLMQNPSDLKAKENYAYVKKKLEDQQNQQDQQDQNQQDQNQNQDQQDQNNDQNNDQKDDQKDQNKDNKDKNDDKQDKDKNQQDKDKNKDQNQDQNQDQNKDKNKDQQDNGNGSSQNPNMSQKEAQKILNMVQAKENETQDKVNKEKAAVLGTNQKEKNW